MGFVWRFLWKVRRRLVTNYGAQFQKRRRGSVTALFFLCHHTTSRDTFVSIKSLYCETKTIATVKKRNNKHEINLLWLGTRRANFSLSGLLLALLSFRISVTRLCLLLHSLVGRGKGSSVQVLQNAWPADRNAWITKLADKSCCPLPLPLLKLPMTKFFLAVMGFQAGETFYQRWTCE